MNKRITYIDPMQAGKVLAALYGLLGLILAPFILLMGILGLRGAGSSFLGGLVAAVLTPFIYALIGFIGGIIVGFVYNFVAKLTGGIRFTLSDDDTPLLP